VSKDIQAAAREDLQEDMFLAFFGAAFLDMFSAYSTCLEMDLFDVCALHPFFFYISQFYQLFYLVFLHTTNQGRI
jgi:hypothetical protein